MDIAATRSTRSTRSADVRHSTLFTFLFAVIIVTVVIPLCFVFFDGLFKIENHRLTVMLQYFEQVMGNRRYWVALTNTAVVALGATVVAVLLGVALAWLLVRTNTPGAALVENLAVIPIFIPPFVGAFAWILLAAPRIGIFNLISRMLGFGEPVDIYTHLGMAFVIGIYLAPYVLMIVASALRSMDPSLEEAGQVSGMSVARTAMTITLPVVAPAIFSSAILTFVITIGLFGTPVLLGWSKQILLITSRIYLEWQDVPPAYGVIAVLSIYLVIFSGAAMLLQHWLLKGRSFVTVTGKGYRPRILQLGNARFLACGAAWTYLTLAVFAPLAVVVAAAMFTYTWSGNFTWANILFLWTSNDVAETLKNSLLITVLAATTTTTFGIFVAWVTCRTTLRGRHLLEFLVLLPASVPGIAFGIGVAFFWLRVPIGIYGTIWIIVLAYLGRYASYAVGTISSSLVQVHPELEESARICGYGWLKTLSQITLPLVRPSIVSSWVLLYSIFITELSMVTILHTTETRTFSILTFNTWYNGRFANVASLSLLQLLLGVAVMFVVRASAKRLGPGE